MRYCQANRSPQSLAPAVSLRHRLPAPPIPSDHRHQPHAASSPLAPATPLRQPLTAPPIPSNHQPQLRAASLLDRQVHSPPAGTIHHPRFDIGSSTPNPLRTHWELGYHVVQNCAACQKIAVSPVVLVCSCSVKHTFCARHLDLFTEKLPCHTKHSSNEEHNAPHGATKNSKAFRPGRYGVHVGFAYFGSTNPDFSLLHPIAMFQHNFGPESSSLSQPVSQGRHSLLCLSYADTLLGTTLGKNPATPHDYPQRLYRDIGVQADIFQVTTKGK